MKRPDVRRFLRGLSMRELQWWQAFYELEPPLDQRIDWLIASVREMIHNVAVDKKHRKPIKDFLLTFEASRDEKPRSGQTWQHQKAMMLVHLMGAGNRQGDRQLG